MSKTTEYISLFLALLPTIVIMFLVLRNVKHKKKPFNKLASVFAISAISCIPAIILELIGTGIITAIFIAAIDGDPSLELTTNQTTLMLYQLVNYIFVVGISEEACKFFTFKWIIFNDREFDNTYDGVIYGAASALGFATLENLMYVFLNSNDPLGTALLRAILSVPMHAITGIFMGYYFGISKYRKYNNIKTNTRPEIPAFIFSVLLHGIYDFTLTIPSIYKTDAANYASIAIIVVIMIGIYALMGTTIHRAKKETHNIYNRYYYEQLDGALQDMYGGKTTSTRKTFLGMPIGRIQGFNPYNPYMGAVPPPPPQYQTAYMYGTQQPYNPYNAPVYAAPQQYNQQPQFVQPQQQGYQPYQNGMTPYGQQQYPNVQNTPYSPPAYTAPVSQTVYARPVAAHVKPQTAAPRRCDKCGAEVSQTAKFCTSCGESLNS